MKSKVEVRLPEEKREQLIARYGDIVLIENLSIHRYTCIARVVELAAEDEILLVRLDTNRTYVLKGDTTRAINKIGLNDKEEVVEGYGLYLKVGEEYTAANGYKIAIKGICDVNIDVTNIRR